MIDTMFLEIVYQTIIILKIKQMTFIIALKKYIMRYA